MKHYQLQWNIIGIAVSDKLVAGKRPPDEDSNDKNINGDFIVARMAPVHVLYTGCCLEFRTRQFGTQILPHLSYAEI
jgi:hypothetical protein